MKRLLKIIGALVLLVVITAMAAPMFISAEFLQQQVVTQVKKSTGRDLKIEGKPSLRILPTIAISVENVTLSNPAGFKSAYFLHVGKLRVGAELWPLLHKQVNVTDITVDDAVVNLEANAAGAKNWEFPTADKKTPAATAASSEPSPLTLGAIHLNNAALTYRTAKAAPVAVEHVTLTLTGADQRAPMKVDIANAEVFGGTIKGVLTRDGTVKATPISAKFALSGIQMEPLMIAASGASKFTGKSDIAFDVTMQGATPQAMMQMLNGKGTLKIADGALKDFDIAQILRSAQKGFLVPNNETRSTDFTEMTASFTITQGILSNHDFAMKSPILRVAGSGTVNLPAQHLNYKLTPTIVSTFKGQGGRDTADGLSIPLLITGAWDNPQITPDVGNLIEEGLKNPQALKEKIGGIAGQVKKLNSPDDIGKALSGGLGGMLGGGKK